MLVFRGVHIHDLNYEPIRIMNPTTTLCFGGPEEFYHPSSLREFACSFRPMALPVDVWNAKKSENWVRHGFYESGGNLWTFQ